MNCKYWVDENDKLTTELEEARASQTQLESRVRELEATTDEWGNDDAGAWWEEGCTSDNLYNLPAGEEPEQDSAPIEPGTDPELARDGVADADDVADAGDDEHHDAKVVEPTDRLRRVLQHVMDKAMTSSHVAWRAYERLHLPALPVSGDTGTWLTAMKLSCARAGEGCSDGLELAWANECSSATFEQLSTLSWANSSSLS